ncbi:MAG TPA: response regulator transcription factor [Candidatus Acidoferrales bacterium]|nr:response regulator transcription factor [Candidatus Acidoferrales bacterium]
MNAKILLADDHDVMRKGIRAHLNGRCGVCAEAVNGKEAVEKAVELKPDIIVMDISMPVMNGLEAIRQIRKLKIPAKIVVLSMHETPQVAKSAREAGADACLAKSAGTAQLLRTIDELLQFGNLPDSTHELR